MRCSRSTTLAVTPVLLACLHPRVLNKLMSRLLGLARQPPLEHPLSGRTLAVALGWSFAVWICNGVRIWLLTIRLGAPIGSSLLLAIGGHAFAWSVGFIVVFAPAGVGPARLCWSQRLARSWALAGRPRWPSSPVP